MILRLQNAPLLASRKSPVDLRQEAEQSEICAFRHGFRGFLLAGLARVSPENVHSIAHDGQWSRLRTSGFSSLKVLLPLKPFCFKRMVNLSF